MLLAALHLPFPFHFCKYAFLRLDGCHGLSVMSGQELTWCHVSFSCSVWLSFLSLPQQEVKALAEDTSTASGATQAQQEAETVVE